MQENPNLPNTFKAENNPMAFNDDMKSGRYPKTTIFKNNISDAQNQWCGQGRHINSLEYRNINARDNDFRSIEQKRIENRNKYMFIVDANKRAQLNRETASIQTTDFPCNNIYLPRNILPRVRSVNHKSNKDRLVMRMEDQSFETLPDVGPKGIKPHNIDTLDYNYFVKGKFNEESSANLTQNDEMLQVIDDFMQVTNKFVYFKDFTDDKNKELLMQAISEKEKIITLGRRLDEYIKVNFDIVKMTKSKIQAISSHEERADSTPKSIGNKKIRISSGPCRARELASPSRVRELASPSRVIELASPSRVRELDSPSRVIELATLSRVSELASPCRVRELASPLHLKKTLNMQIADKRIQLRSMNTRENIDGVRLKKIDSRILLTSDPEFKQEKYKRVESEVCKEQEQPNSVVNEDPEFKQEKYKRVESEVCKEKEQPNSVVNEDDQAEKDIVSFEELKILDKVLTRLSYEKNLQENLHFAYNKLVQNNQGIKDNVFKSLCDNITENILEDKPEDKPEDMPEDKPEDMLEYMPENMPEDMPEDKPQDKPEDKTEDMLEYMPENMPEDMSEDMPEDMPEYMPENMPLYSPEDLQEDMPEYKRSIIHDIEKSRQEKSSSIYSRGSIIYNSTNPDIKGNTFNSYKASKVYKKHQPQNLDEDNDDYEEDGRKTMDIINKSTNKNMRETNRGSIFQTESQKRIEIPDNNDIEENIWDNMDPELDKQDNMNESVNKFGETVMEDNCKDVKQDDHMDGDENEEMKEEVQDDFFGKSNVKKDEEIQEGFGQ